MRFKLLQICYCLLNGIECKNETFLCTLHRVQQFKSLKVVRHNGKANKPGIEAIKVFSYGNGEGGTDCDRDHPVPNQVLFSYACNSLTKCEIIADETSSFID